MIGAIRFLKSVPRITKQALCSARFGPEWAIRTVPYIFPPIRFGSRSTLSSASQTHPLYGTVRLFYKRNMANSVWFDNCTVQLADAQQKSCILCSCLHRACLCRCHGAWVVRHGAANEARFSEILSPRSVIVHPEQCFRTSCTAAQTLAHTAWGTCYH